MLALTPVPLKTAGERSVFAELTRWDTGGSVRAAVMASIPLADGSSQRRVSDAVLFVPEGLAVVRIAEVVRQSGVVTATPEGAWTIQPESGPSQALQLSGGGSTPLDGLMRAGMDTAMKLRRAGLEPGRIARLTILVGQVTGLVPADGDLGEGDQVATLDPRSLLLGIARASRYAGVDNPRLWTTADVRAALEALGLEGRGPSVDQLNGEGFPYSPYVLRRADLLTPAAMAASDSGDTPPPGVVAASAAAAASVPAAASGAESAATAAPAMVPAVREQPAAEAIAQAVAASAAAARAPEALPASNGSHPMAVPTPVPVQRDTVAIDGPENDDVGISGLFAQPAPGRAPERAPEPEAQPGPDADRRRADRRTAERRRSGSQGQEPAPRTAVLPVAGPQAAPGSAPPPAADPGPAQQRFAYWTESVAAPDEDEESEPSGSRVKAALLILLGLLVVGGLVAVGWLLLQGRDGDPSDAASAPTTASAAPGPQTGAVQTLAGTGYTVAAVDVQTTCAGHAYGKVAEFFAATDCTGLSRALYSAQAGAGAVVVSVSRVQMPDATSARALRELSDANGSGNVSDLLREGVRYTGGPAELSGAEYASALSGSVVTIVEAAAADEDAPVPAADLDRMAGEALALEVPPFPAG